MGLRDAVSESEGFASYFSSSPPPNRPPMPLTASTALSPSFTAPPPALAGPRRQRAGNFHRDVPETASTCEQILRECRGSLLGDPDEYRGHDDLRHLRDRGLRGSRLLVGPQADLGNLDRDAIAGALDLPEIDARVDVANHRFVDHESCRLLHPHRRTSSRSDRPSRSSRSDSDCRGSPRSSPSCRRFPARRRHRRVREAARRSFPLGATWAEPRSAGGPS